MFPRRPHPAVLVLSLQANSVSSYRDARNITTWSKKRWGPDTPVLIVSDQLARVVDLDERLEVDDPDRRAAEVESTAELEEVERLQRQQAGVGAVVVAAVDVAGEHVPHPLPTWAGVRLLRASGAS